jgi:hypothetical protein
MTSNDAQAASDDAPQIFVHRQFEKLPFELLRDDILPLLTQPIDRLVLSLTFIWLRSVVLADDVNGQTPALAMKVLGLRGDDRDPYYANDLKCQKEMHQPLRLRVTVCRRSVRWLRALHRMAHDRPYVWVCEICLALHAVDPDTPAALSPFDGPIAAARSENHTYGNNVMGVDVTTGVWSYRKQAASPGVHACGTQRLGAGY